MAWYPHTLAFVVSDDPVAAGADPRDLLDGHKGDFEPFVYAPSRNGRLLSRLRRIWEQAATGKNRYLLEDACVLQHDAVKHSVSQIEGLIAERESNPTLVVEATKDSYEPVITLHAEGFEPLPAELVYPSDAVIRDGWVYNYSEEEVRRLLDESRASRTPCPDGDDDGESLAYLFNLLKAHLSLLRIAAESGQVVVYGELNQ
jgi:hypothetical protein